MIKRNVCLNKKTGKANLGPKIIREWRSIRPLDFLISQYIHVRIVEIIKFTILEDLRMALAFCLEQDQDSSHIKKIIRNHLNQNLNSLMDALVKASDVNRKDMVRKSRG